MGEHHTIVSIRDEKKFRVLVSEAPSGARFQWAIAFDSEFTVGDPIHTDNLNTLLYDLVNNG